MYSHRMISLLLWFLLLTAAPPTTKASMKTKTSLEIDNYRFRQKIDSALNTVKTILETTRAPQLASDVDHSYRDKYALAEFLTNKALASQLNALERLGLDDDKLKRLKGMSDEGRRSVSLLFEKRQTCGFIEEKTVEMDSPHRVERRETTEEEDGSRSEKVTNTKVVTKVQEYHWNFTVDYSLLAYVGNDPDPEENKIELQSRSGSKTIVVVGNKKPPCPTTSTISPHKLDLTWFLQQVITDEAPDKEQQRVCGFAIDRSAKTCHTPRRNDDIFEAIKFFEFFQVWGENVSDYFVFISQQKGSQSSASSTESCPDLGMIMEEDIFIPVLPLFEEPQDDESPASSPLLSPTDVKLFLDEQCRTMDKKIAELKDTFPSNNTFNLITSAEAILSMLMRHMISIANDFMESVQYVEDMLHSQLIKAIGKEVKPFDFEDFFRFHYRKMFKENFVPRPFSYAIRRPHHYPDGVLAIEGSRVDGEEDGDRGLLSDPIMTITRKIENPGPMHFPINAATTIEFMGDQYLHAWVLHDFKGDMGAFHTSGFNLVARARQFSSFLLMTGTISGPNAFQPRHAIILQNKDEVLLPLLLEQLPTPKEFKDAIASLSPEQQRFAIAFRNMQLESSVFGVCVVQLKPQLEMVLGLPYDSLTKEIRLTRDLLSLFIEYQIPSDLVTYNGEGDVAVGKKVARVKEHVAAVLEMISDAKAAELEEEKKRQEMMGKAKVGEKPRHTESREWVKYAMDDESDVMLNDFEGKTSVRSYRPRKLRYASMMEDSTASNLRSRSSKQTTEASSPLLETMYQPKADDSSVKPTDENSVDFTLIPKQLDEKFEVLDEDSALRPTKIKTGDVWTKKSQKNLLTLLQTQSLNKEEQTAEKNKAFDLLDALSKSGALPIAYAELHVMVAATHRFDKSLMATVIQDNMNPIEKMEKSLLIVSSTVNGLPARNLVNDAFALELAKSAPKLLDRLEEENVDAIEDDS